MSLSTPFVERPVATSLLALAVLVGGASAYVQLPVAPLPRVDMPTLNVSAALPGASPETMAAVVATPLERRFGRIAGVTEMTSSSTQGSTSLTLQFDLDRDIDAAARDVQGAINAAAGELPANLPGRPSIRKANSADAPILILALTSATLPLAAVFDAATSVLAQKLAQLPGVGQIYIGGGQQPAVRIQADPEALAGVGLTLADVRALVQRSNVNLPNGGLQGAHTFYVLATGNQGHRAADFADLVLAWRGGSAVRLRDVARVVDDVENSRVAAWHNGTRTVLLIVRRQPGANIIATIDRIRAALPDLRGWMSPAIDVAVVSDRSRTIRASVADVEATLVLTVVLVFAVVLVFLRSFSATLIPSMAVPLSLVGTFAAMYGLGFSLNNLSLMALTIATGFVVDDAIVVTEAIARARERGLGAKAAALVGAQEIGFTVLSMTVSLLAVFIPLLAMGGVVGRLFREFSVTLALAIAVSAAVSLILTPMLCALFLRPPPAPAAEPAWARACGAAFHGLERAYARSLTWVLGHRRPTLALTLATAALSVSQFISIPKGMFPQQDTGVVMGFTEAPQNVAFQAMAGRQQAVDAVLRGDPDVAHAMSFTGVGSGGSGNTGMVFLDLVPWGRRRRTPDQIIADLRPKLAQVPGILTFLQASQDVRMGGRSTRSQYLYTLQAAHLRELNVWAPKVVAALAELPELRDVNSDQQTAGLQLSLKLDRDAAARLGVTPRAIDDALYDALGQRQVSVMYGTLNQYRVVLEVPPEFSQGPGSLNRLFVPTSAGAPLALGQVARAEVTATPLSVNHEGQFPSVTLSFNLAPKVALGEAVAAIRTATDRMGLPADVRLSVAGTAAAFRDANAKQAGLILAALLAVYIVLGILYESYLHPLTILSTLPSAGLGALLALRLNGMDFGIIALIGVILLIGLVKKNAIMMIDVALELERREGRAPEAAIFHACVLRLRPILMTTFAALFGALPLALGTGNGAELRRPLGVAIVGGLLVSQILTLYTTPVVYLGLARLAARWRRPTL